MRLLELLVRNAWAQEAAAPPVEIAARAYFESPLFALDLLLIVAIVALFKLFARWPRYERWLVAAALLAFAFYEPILLPAIYGGSFMTHVQATPWFFWAIPILLLAAWLFLKTYTRWLDPPQHAASPAPPPRLRPEPPPPQAGVRASAPVTHDTVPEPAPRPVPAATRKEGVFLSYRRDDSADVTGRIYDRLVQRFGKEQIFKDVDSIPLGVDFREHLGEVVGRCSVVLVVIGDRWLSAGSPGARRLDDAADFVRIEIESALERRIPVVPVLVRGAAIPGDTELPQSLRPLAYRNGLAVRADPDFHRDMDRLITGLQTHLAR